MPTPTSEIVLVDIPSIQEIYTSGQQLESPLSVYSHHSVLSPLEHNDDDSSDESITDRDESNSSDDDLETEDEHSEENSADEEEETVAPLTRKINIPPAKKAIVRSACAVQSRIVNAVRSTAPRPVPRPPATKDRATLAARPPLRQAAFVPQIRVTKPVEVKAFLKPKDVTAPRAANTRTLYNPPPPLKRINQQLKVHAKQHGVTSKKLAASTSYLSPVSESAYDSEVSSSFASSQTSHNYSSISSIADEVDGSDVASTITALSAVAAGAALATSSSENNNKKKSKTSGIMSLAVSTAALVAVAYVAYRIWTHMHAMKGEIEKLKVDIEATQVGRDGVDSAEVEAIARRQIQQLLNEPVNVPAVVPAMSAPQETASPQTEQVSSEAAVTKVDDDATKSPTNENKAPLASVIPIQGLQPQPVENTSATAEPQYEVSMVFNSSIPSVATSDLLGSLDSKQQGIVEQIVDSIPDTIVLVPQVNDIDVALIASLPVPETVPVLVSDIELPVIAESKDEVIVTPTPPPPAIVPKVTKAAKPTRRKVQITVKDDSKMTEIGNELSKNEPTTQEPA